MPLDAKQQQRETSLSAAARTMGRSVGSLRKWMDKGMPADRTGEVGKAVMVSIPEIVDWLVLNAHGLGIQARHNSPVRRADAVQAPNGDAEPDGKDYWDKEDKKAAALLKRDKLAEQRGTLADVDVVKAEVARLLSEVTTQLEGVSRQAAEQVALTDNPGRCSEIISKAIAEAVDGLWADEE